MKTTTDPKSVTLPLDKYNHVALEGAHTDPYGSLEYAIGSGDDFHCFDYAFFEHGGRNYLVIHATVNSETGSFIQDASYAVIDRTDLTEGEELIAAGGAVSDALDWIANNNIRHDKRGWNQDPYYFVRALARDLYRHGIESEEIAALSRDARAFRYGSAKLNRAIERVAPGLRGRLPISRRPNF